MIDKAELLEQIEKRKGAMFIEAKMINYAFYDCITFCLSIYQEMGIVRDDFIIEEIYTSFSKDEKTFDQIVREVERTGGFNEVDKDDPLQVGDMLIFTKGTDGHHAAIYIGNRTIAHCVPSSHVCEHSFIFPLTTGHAKTYRPR